MTRTWPSAIILAASVVLGACGSSGATAGPSPAAQGKSIAMKKGCTTCHGATANGGLGPSWIDLSGATVQLDDGSTVKADDSYLTDSIRTPSAKKVAGYSIAMPEIALTDGEIAALVAYIDSLRVSPPTTDEPR